MTIYFEFIPIDLSGFAASKIKNIHNLRATARREHSTTGIN